VKYVFHPEPNEPRDAQEEMSVLFRKSNGKRGGRKDRQAEKRKNEFVAWILNDTKDASNERQKVGQAYKPIYCGPHA
jgi:hypothetical protein